MESFLTHVGQSHEKSQHPSPFPHPFPPFRLGPDATMAAVRADYDAKVAELKADLEATRGEKDKMDTDLAYLKVYFKSARSDFFLGGTKPPLFYLRLQLASCFARSNDKFTVFRLLQARGGAAKNIL